MSDPGELTPQPAPELPREASLSQPASNGRGGSHEPHSNGHEPNGNWRRLALGAHEDMEAYRRVLAAAVANEKSAMARVAEATEVAGRVQNDLGREAHARGLAEGRVTEVERERDLMAARMRSAENELRDARRTHDQALDALRMKLDAQNLRIAQLEAQADTLRRERHGLGFLALRLRSRVMVVAAIAAYLLSLGCFTRMVMELLGTNEPPLELLVVTLGLFVAGVICHGQAANALARELRAEG